MSRRSRVIQALTAVLELNGYMTRSPEIRVHQPTTYLSPEIDRCHLLGSFKPTRLSAEANQPVLRGNRKVSTHPHTYERVARPRLQGAESVAEGLQVETQPADGRPSDLALR